MTTSPFDGEARAAFADSVGRFVAERYDFDTHRRIAASEQGYGSAEWSEMAELGWTCLSLPADQGGLGGGAAETAIVMEGIGRGLLLEPYIATTVLCGTLIASCASDAQKGALMPAIAAAETVIAFAHQDSAPTSAARRPDGGWVVNGGKTLVLHGPCADWLIVSAPIDGEGLALFLLAGDTPGVTRKAYRLVDGRPIAEVVFADAGAERLGGGDATGAIARALDHAVAACCAEAVGAMAALNRETLAFAKTRQQFGVPIASFQALQHRMVDMTIAEQEVRSIAQAAAHALDAGHPEAGRLVSAAKVRACRAGRMVGESAVQIHGGIGMTSELAIGSWFKRLLAIESLFGDIDFHLDRVAAGGDAI